MKQGFSLRFGALGGQRRFQFHMTPYFIPLLALIILLFGRGCMMEAKRFVDLRAGYSGTVVGRGADDNWFDDWLYWYLIIEDSAGVRTKRYVLIDSSIECAVGDTVIKERGIRHPPVVPGKRTLTELQRMMHERKKRLQRK